MRGYIWWGLCALLLTLLLMAGPESWAPWYRPGDRSEPTVAKISNDGSALEFRNGPSPSIDGAAVKAQLKSGDFKAGDLVKVTDASSPGKPKLGIEILRSAPIEPGQRLLTLTLTAALFAFLLFLLARGKLRLLIVGADNRYSKSKVQLVVWLVVLLTAYLSTLWLRAWYSGGVLLGGILIPPTLLQLAGLSGVSFAAAKGITQAKQNGVENQRAAVQAGTFVPGAQSGMTTTGRSFAVLPTPGGVPQTVLGPDPTQEKGQAGKPSWRDLLSDDSPGQNPDLGDIQMVLITLIAVAVFLASAYHGLGALEMRASISLPELDQSLLALLGVSHLTYLGKKAASDPNPPS